MKLIIALCCVSLLSGCYYSKADLKNDPGNPPINAEVMKSYKETYRNAFKMSKECLQGVVLNGEVNIFGETDHDLKEGSIEQKASGGGTLITTSILEIKGLSEDKTKLTLFLNNDGWLSFGVTKPSIDDIIRWVNGDTECLSAATRLRNQELEQQKIYMK